MVKVGDLIGKIGCRKNDHLCEVVNQILHVGSCAQPLGNGIELFILHLCEFEKDFLFLARHGVNKLFKVLVLHQVVHGFVSFGVLVKDSLEFVKPLVRILNAQALSKFFEDSVVKAVVHPRARKFSQHGLECLFKQLVGVII